jgi:hypothetical protein
MRLRVMITVLAALFALVSSGGVAAGSPPGGTAVPLNNSSLAPGHHDNNHYRRDLRMQPAWVTIRDWDCSPGYSCYYDGRNGTGWRWVAPSCGWFDLGRMRPPFNDRISSIWNRGGGAIDLYNWDGRSRWIYLGTVPIGARGNLPPQIDNIVDAVRIAC